MELQRESRTKFYVKVDQPVNINIDGVKADGDVIEFWKSGADHTFKTYQDCEKWLTQYGKNKMEFAPFSRVVKGFENVKTKAIKITEDVWGKMHRFMVSPDEYSTDDFVVFQSQLANTAPDRDGQRFSLDYLKSFQKSIIGKSKLTGHDHSSTGEGRFFDAEIEKLSVDDFVQTLDFVPDKKFIKKLGKIEADEGGIHWLLTKYYMPKTMEKEIHAIKSGIKGHFMSIGFAPPQGPIAVKESGTEGETLWHEWQNTNDFEVEAIEGSDVYLGAQYGAGNRKSYKDSSDVPVQGVDEAKAAKSDDLPNPPADGSEQIIKTNEVMMAKFQMKALEFETELEVPAEQQEAIEKAFAEVDAKVVQLVDEHAQDVAEKEAAIADAQKQVEAVQADVAKFTEAEKAATERAKAFREDVENWILKAQFALKQFKFDEVEAKRADIGNKTDAELFDIRKNVTAELSKQPKFNSAQLSPDFDMDNQGGESKKQIEYQAPYVLD